MTAKPTSWISINRLLPVYLSISTTVMEATEGIIHGIIPITAIVLLIITEVFTILGTAGIVRGLTVGMTHGFTVVGTDIIPDTTEDIGDGDIPIIMAEGMEEDTITTAVITMAVEIITATAAKATMPMDVVLLVQAIMYEEVLLTPMQTAAILPQALIRQEAVVAPTVVKASQQAVKEVPATNPPATTIRRPQAVKAAVEMLAPKQGHAHHLLRLQ